MYDGHGGRAAVDFVADKLGKNVIAAAALATSSSNLQEGEDEVMAAIRSAYLTTDSEFLSQVCTLLATTLNIGPGLCMFQLINPRGL